MDYAPDVIKNNRDIVLHYSSKWPDALTVSPQFSSDEAITLSLIAQDAWACLEVSADLLADDAYKLKAASVNSAVLRLMPYSRQFAHDILSLNGLALRDIRRTFRHDNELVTLAIAQDRRALRFAPETIQRAMISRDASLRPFASSIVRRQGHVFPTLGSLIGTVSHFMGTSDILSFSRTCVRAAFELQRSSRSPAGVDDWSLG